MKKSDKQNLETAGVWVHDEASTFDLINFPTPWTCRTMTPVKRVPHGQLWAQPNEYVPRGYGGPNN